MRETLAETPQIYGKGGIVMAMPIFKVKPFLWGALSPKQRFVFTWWRNPKWKDKDCIIGEGAIRSGKTVSMALSYID